MLSSFSARFSFGASSPVGGGGINPVDVPGLVLWLDADDTPTLTLSGPTTVTAWADKSEAGNNATTDSGTPTFSTSGGKNGVVFSNSRMYTNCIPATGAGGRTLFVVTSEASLPGSPPWYNGPNSHILHYGTSYGYFMVGAYSAYGILNLRGYQPYYGNNYLQDGFQTSESGTNSDAKVISCRYNGTVDAWKANNTIVGSNTIALDTANPISYWIYTFNPEGITLGSRIGRIDPIRGPGPEEMCNSVKIHEVLAYDNAISDSDWDGVVNYLTNKWNII
jgi:hypothetical protein